MQDGKEKRGDGDGGKALKGRKDKSRQEPGPAREERGEEGAGSWVGYLGRGT